jgi:hypothetical protein
MAMSASEILNAIAPTLGSPEQRTVFLAMAEEQTSNTSFGDRRPYAVAYRAAHEMTLLLDPAFSSGTGGAIASKKEGDLSISYFKGGSGATGNGSSDLSLTVFGQRLISLGKRTILTLSVTGMAGAEDPEPRME